MTGMPLFVSKMTKLPLINLKMTKMPLYIFYVYSIILCIDLNLLATIYTALVAYCLKVIADFKHDNEVDLRV